jgi:hypothetical protein
MKSKIRAASLARPEPGQASVTPINRMKLVTIIVKSSLWDRLHSDLTALGVDRYVLTTLDASWSRGDNGGALSDPKRIRVEALVAYRLRHLVADLVKRRYAGEGLMAYANDVEGFGV